MESYALLERGKRSSARPDRCSVCVAALCPCVAGVKAVQRMLSSSSHAPTRCACLGALGAVVDADAVDVVTDWASARARALTATNVTVRGPELAVLYHALSKNIVATPPSPSVVAASVSFVDSVAPALLAAIHAVQARAPTVT